jgi:hypothetical protein
LYSTGQRVVMHKLSQQQPAVKQKTQPETRLA